MTPWPTARLGDVCQIVSGATPKTTEPAYWDGDIAWATPKDLSALRTKHISATGRRLSKRGLSSCSAVILPPGSVLLSSRAPIGLVAINTVPMATNQGFKSLVPDPSAVCADYLYWWLRANTHRLQSLGRGATFTEISKAIVAEIELPLPALDEQRRIAAVLDQVDALRSKRADALNKLGLLIRATFSEMFGGLSRSPVFPGALPLQHERGWRWVPISDVARMGTGHTPDRAVAEYWDGEISWINLTEIRRLDGRWCPETDAKITAAGVRNSSAVVHPTGTVCFSRTASIGFVTVMAAPMATSQDFVTWTCGELLNPTFLMHALLMSRSVLRSASSGSTHKTIYVRDAERFSVLLPPRALQDEFASRVEQTEVLRTSMESAQPLLDGLFASARHRAFAGAV